MSLTPETLPRHELVGLRVRVVESTDPTQVGIEGRVVRETMRTLVVDTGAPSASTGAAGDVASSDAGVRTVPKQGRTFEFAIDEAADRRKGSGTAFEPGDSGGVVESTSSPGEGVAYVTVDGDVLLARPAERTEKGVDSQWR